MKKIFLLFLISTLIYSCDIKEKGIEGAENKIFIESKYGTQVIKDYDLPFTAKDASGNDITSQVKFYINGESQAGNNLRFANTGNNEVTEDITIEGTTLKSDPLTMNVIEPQSSTKILVEDFTGTWCTNCPRVIYHLEEAMNTHDHIISTSIHLSPVPGLDPYPYQGAAYFKETYNIDAGSGLPTPFVNRYFIWNDDQINELTDELDKKQPMGLYVSSTVDNTEINITVKVRFDMDFSKENTKLVVYLNENGLHHDQSNGTSFYGGQNPIPNFEHNHVLRLSPTGGGGINIDNNNNANGIFTYNTTVQIPSEIEDINNCEIVAFTAYVPNPDEAEKIKVINVQKAAINMTQDFD